VVIGGPVGDLLTLKQQLWNERKQKGRRIEDSFSGLSQINPIIIAAA